MSVIIPAYNQGNYLGEAIESVLNQSFSDFELIVVDDGSTDNTAQVVAAYSDSRIQYARQKNQGLSSARNTGIVRSSAPYLTYLDSDDMFLPDKISLLVSEFITKPDLGFVAAQAIPIDEQSLPLGKIFDKPLPKPTSNLLLGNPLHVGSVMVRRSWQEKAGLFDVTLHSYEDWDMWLRLAMIGCPMGWVDKPVSLYRFHPDQMTRIGIQMTTATFAVLDKIFKDPRLPESWLELRSQAYSQACLRAAAQSYIAGDYVEAKRYLTQAIKLNPELLAHDGERLVRHIIGWSQLPKTRDPIRFLERIYDNLPDHLEALKRRKNRELGRIAINMAFEAYHRGDSSTTRSAVLLALHYSPRFLINRGVLAIFIRSSFQLMNV